MINLLLSGNKNVQDGLLIVVLSYIKYNDEPVNIYFASMDLHEYNPSFVSITSSQAKYLDSLLKSKNNSSSFISVDCTKEFMDTMGKRTDITSVYTPYTLLRLLGDKLNLPERILYLDTDTMILNNIHELFNLDFEDCEFLAAHDYLGQTWISKDYQNAGVMLLNMKKIKETGLFEKCRKSLAEKKTAFLDQDALNKHVIKRKFLDFKYNEQHKRQDDTVIRHFSKTIRWWPFFHTINIKPWMVDKVHSVLKTNSYDEILNEYSSKKEEFHNN